VPSSSRPENAGPRAAPAGGRPRSSASVTTGLRSPTRSPRFGRDADAREAQREAPVDELAQSRHGFPLTRNGV
jgi:hypothetical protein